MEVDILQPTIDHPRAVLKLYDWRFAEQLRKDNKIEPWTPNTGSAFVDFVRSGRALDFLDRLRHDDDFEEPEEGWDTAENETYLYNSCMDMWKAEIAVYDKLQRYQGAQIPRLLAPVTLRIGPTYGDTASDDTELFQVKGILLERIQGFTLANLTDNNAPREAWQTIVDKAIQNVHIFSDHNILNEDIRASNILVSPESNQGGYRVTSIDFAQCRFREEDESDLEWGRAKWSQDEEGAVGMVMRSRLQKVGFDLEYQNSGRYLEWADRE